MHLFRHAINRLIGEGHYVKVAIINKDVLEDLVKKENWDYVNIFPKGRRSKSNNKWRIFSTTALNFIKTLWRLYNLTRSKKYDLYITDDCLSIIGYFRKTKVLYFQDDDLSVVPENSILLSFASNVFAPNCTDLGKFNVKKIGFNSYKELSYLNPETFTPLKSIVDSYHLTVKKYVLIRLVSLTASHDAGKKGLNDALTRQLIDIIIKKGLIPVISSERQINSDLGQYCLKIRPEDFIHILAFAKLFIGDSHHSFGGRSSWNTRFKV